jgi:hypothetical protein
MRKVKVLQKLRDRKVDLSFFHFHIWTLTFSAKKSTAAFAFGGG